MIFYPLAISLLPCNNDDSCFNRLETNSYQRNMTNLINLLASRCNITVITNIIGQSYDEMINIDKLRSINIWNIRQYTLNQRFKKIY